MRYSDSKRKSEDRRLAEVGPPQGWRERRKTVERRQPEVVEIPFSEWLAHLPTAAVESEEK
jgi:hypothetical protein